MNNQIRHAQSVLRALNENGINAVVAGGAPRDWLLGRKATDVDVFILSDINSWDDNRISIDTIERLNGQDRFDERFLDINRLGGGTDDVHIYSGVNGIKSVYNSTYGTNNINVQLIFVRDFTVESVVSRFPDICQAWMPNGGAIRATSEFFRAHDSQYSVITRSNAHTQKLRDKFPDYDFIEDEQEVGGWDPFVSTSAPTSPTPPPSPWFQTLAASSDREIRDAMHRIVLESSARLAGNNIASGIVSGDIARENTIRFDRNIDTDNRIFF